MKNKFLLSFTLLLFVILGCNEKNKHVEPLKVYNPADEITQTIENTEAEIFYELAMDQYENRNYNTATNLLKSSLALERNPITYNQLGLISKTLKNFDEAIEYHKSGQVIDSTYVINFINEARILEKLGKFDQAEKALRMAISNTESDYFKANANFYLAILFFNDRNQCEKSKKHFIKASSLKNDPNLKKYYEKIGNELNKYCS